MSEQETDFRHRVSLCSKMLSFLFMITLKNTKSEGWLHAIQNPKLCKEECSEENEFDMLHKEATQSVV